jgi:predicted nucleotidyltransferase
MQGVKLVILFGSQATGHVRPGSDTDVAVLADHVLSLAEKSDLSQELAKELKVSEDIIDIVDLQIASPLLQQQISTHGKLLRGSADDWLRWRVLAWKRYLGTAKFRRLREQSLMKSLHA